MKCQKFCGPTQADSFQPAITDHYVNCLSFTRNIVIYTYHIYLWGTITDDSNVLVRLTVRGDFRQYKEAQEWSWKPFSELIPRDIELLCYSCLWSLNISFFCSLNSFKTDACCHHRTGQSSEIIQPWLATIAEHNYLSLPFHIRVLCFLPIVMLSNRQ